ncbi:MULTISPECIES: ArsC family reductase [Proteus]|uniref:Glutaredoxin-like protein n=1 Tax=Proteus vulgaris TaxID=585 RepID=A0A379FD77_PROVU|nr:MULTISPECIES: ArsC family reductase [Proteus]NBN60552.1 ArsC family reductase [Proteus sp. G2639]RNT28785.1 ArsC family reductase [Proteus mirabilis]AYY80984.1 ArsC family reductase [Proteus vulgaris]MBG5971857.1 ArsC family reductase [Proteus vulgaris]MBG5983724.1 ArsC family reductase [Proteus vulgaris]
MSTTNLTYTMYGIKNCDTIKKARKWLDDNHVPYTFHDYRKEGLTEALLRTFTENLDWQTLVNKRGTTWRQLSDEEKNAITDVTSAISLMLDKPAIIKRPILVSSDNRFIVGFNTHDYLTFTGA